MAISAIASRKRSLSDMTFSRLPSKLIDDESYRITVLCLGPHVTEEEIDGQLAREAQELGLMPIQIPTDIDGMTSSLSATTIASDPNNQSSILSESTAPTSCSSSERRPITQSSQFSDKSPTTSNAPSIVSDIERRRDSGFRKGFRRMAGFRKRKSALLESSSTVTSINSQIANATNSDRLSTKSDLKSPSSIKSSKSSWSNPPSATKSSYERVISEDPEALKRSMDCKELLSLRGTQLEEKSRFLQFQRTAFARLSSQHTASKQDILQEQSRVVMEATEKNEAATDELEARQLEDEMKLVKDFEIEKRTAMVRLRHMEAYCQNPTPPPTPVDAITGRLSEDAHPLAQRKVTDKDYHNLAQQYRERDAMDVLHASKINVLRGKQKKTVENFVLKKEREVEALENKYAKDIDKLDREARKDEDSLRLALGVKRAQIETRWRLQALVERTKLEKITGLKYAPLSDVLAVDDQKDIR